MRKLPTVLLVAGSALALDIASKVIVKSSFNVNEEVVIVRDFFSFSYHQNSGVAFGALSDLPESFRVSLLVILALSVMLFLIQLMRKTKSRFELLVLSAVLGGASGNLLNRLWLGYVVDFLHFHWEDVYHFPTFNIADIFICVGVTGLLFASVKTSKATR